MASDQVLTLTDGTTTVDLLRGPVRVEQDGLALAVADQRQSELGGAGTWADVEESPALEIIADASDTPGATWNRIRTMLAQAARVQRGSGEAGVRLQVRPTGSRLSPSVILESQVLGGSTPSLAASYMRLLEGGAVASAGIRLQRRGAWLDPAYDEVTSTAAASQQIQTLAFPDHPTLSPLSLGMQATNAPAFRFLNGMVLIGAAASDFTIVEAESLAATNFVSVADTGARGGAYLSLITASGPTGTFSAKVTIPAVTRADIYVMIKNPTVAVSLAVQLSHPRFETFSPSGAQFGLVQVARVIPPREFFARPVYVGRVESTTALTRLWLYLVTSTAAEEGQIDSIIIHRDAGPQTRMIELRQTVGYNSGATDLSPLTVLHTPLTRPAPGVVQSENGALFTPIVSAAHYGDPALEMQGATLSVLPLFCQPRETPLATNANGRFLPRTTLELAGSDITFRTTARRFRAYLAPE